MIWQRGIAGAVIAFDLPNIIVPNQNEKNRFNPPKKITRKKKNLQWQNSLPIFSPLFLPTTLPYLT